LGFWGFRVRGFGVRGSEFRGGGGWGLGFGVGSFEVWTDGLGDEEPDDISEQGRNKKLVEGFRM
jgi:hypothetical protein